MVAAALQRPHFYCCQTFQEIEKSSSDYRLIQIVKMCFFHLMSMLTYPIYFLGQLLSPRVTTAAPVTSTQETRSVPTPTKAVQTPVLTEQVIEKAVEVKPCWDKKTDQIIREFNEICEGHPLLYVNDHRETFAKGIEIRDRNPGQSKNRSGNILPNEATRVTFPEDHPDFYYNANWVFGKSAIACQGPTDDSIEDFWQMVWLAKAGRIVMLTNLEEDNQEKCAKYWVSGGVLPGPHRLSVETFKECEDPNISIRTFVLIKDEEQKTVVQSQVCDCTDEALKDLVKNLLKTGHVGPLVVHCSTGVGRTGVFLAIYEVMKRIQQGENDPDLISKVVSELRDCQTGRNGIVQNAAQYLSIYRIVKELASDGG